MQVNKNINNESTVKRSLKNIKMIVVHHTGSKSLFANIIKYLRRPDYISVHYVVSQKGEVVQTVDDNHIAYHAGVSEYPNFYSRGRSLNWCSISIEVHSDGHHYTDEQREATKELIKYLMGKYDVPARYVTRHKDISPKRKWDIGDNFWNIKYSSWEDYQNSLIEVDMKKSLKDGIANVEYSLKSLYHLAVFNKNPKLANEASRIADEVRKLKK